MILLALADIWDNLSRIFRDKGDYYGRIDVAADAMLIPGHDPSESVYNWMIHLGGAGIVSNGVGEASNCAILPGFGDGYPVEFSGRILDKIMLYQHGWQLYTGTNSTYSGGTRIQSNSSKLTQGIIGIMKMGNGNEPSSIGTGSIISLAEYGGRIHYLGKGETSNKRINLWESDGKSRQQVIDAGVHGGLRLTGEIVPYGGLNERLWLTGSNTAECVIDGNLNAYTATKRRAYISKKGTGIWRLGDVARTGISGIAVEEGTLRFDSLLEKGKACSVGDGSIYTIDKWYSTSETPEEVPYQFKLGSDSANAVLEFTGTNEVYAALRPIALAGDATFRNSGTNIAFASKIAPIDSSERTLTLDGDGGSESSVSNLQDGEGRLSVIKDGEGTWYIDSTNVAFSGSIDVRKGRLVLRGYGGFTWYRWTIRALHGTVGRTLQYLAELAFFDENDMRPYTSLPQATASWGGVNINPEDYRKVIRPGTSGLGRKFSYVYTLTQGEGTGRIFDGNSDTDYTIDCRTNATPEAASGTWVAFWPVEDKPETWLPFVVRMPAGAKPVKSYDFTTRGNHVQSCPKSYLLEASVDGVNWVVVDDEHNGPWRNVGSYSVQWQFNGSGTGSTAGTAWGVEGDPHPNGRILSSWTNAPLTVYSQPVSVSSNAVLEAQGPVQLSSLAVDLGNAGTIKGFSFAANGTLVLSPRPSAGMDLPLTFEDVSGIENIATWHVESNNKSANCRVSVVGGRLHVAPIGFCMSFR